MLHTWRELLHHGSIIKLVALYHAIGASTPTSQHTSHVYTPIATYASIAMVYYDYILTFPLEVTHIWLAKFRISTLLYILTRYAMVANVLYLLAISSKLPNCDVWYRIIGVLSTLGRASVITVFTARTYAIWNRNLFVLAALAPLGIICIIFDGLHVPGLRCHGSSGSKIQATLLSIFVCVLELLAAALTVYSAIKSSKLAIFRSKDLKGFIVRQGVLYFCGVFIFTCGAMILNFAADDSVVNKLLNAITLPFSCLLTSRFLLHLRSFTVGLESNIVQSQGRLSTLRFGVADMMEEFSHSGSDTVRMGTTGNATGDVSETSTARCERGQDLEGGSDWNASASTSRIKLGGNQVPPV